LRITDPFWILRERKAPASSGAFYLQYPLLNSEREIVSIGDDVKLAQDFLEQHGPLTSRGLALRRAW
jgi:hypothetical protein